MSELIGVLLATLVTIFGIKTYTNFQEVSNQAVIAATTASEWAQVNAAATQYIQQNAIAIQAVATASTPAVISIAMLQAAAVNLLPASFSATNPYQQTWQLEVLQPTTGNLQALVMSVGGQTLSDKQAMAVAQLIGAQGGIIPKNDSGLYSTPNTAYGVAGSWQISTASYTGVSMGELADLQVFNNGQLQNPYVYRNAVPGQPQLNSMNTPLLMRSTQTVGSTCSTIGAIAQDGSGNVVDCPIAGVWTSAGGGSWKTPVATYASLPTTANSAGDVRMVTSLGHAFTWNGSGWASLAVDQNGNMNISGTATMGIASITQTESVGSGCGPSGMLAINVYGQPVACQNGIWQSALTSAISNYQGVGGYNGNYTFIGYHTFCAAAYVAAPVNGGGGVVIAGGQTAQGQLPWDIYAYDNGGQTAIVNAICVD